jgi:hypothetical protein
MIIHDFDILGVPYNPPKTDAPLVVDSHTHLAHSLSFQQFRTKPQVTVEATFLAPVAGLCGGACPSQAETVALALTGHAIKTDYFRGFSFADLRRRTPGPPPFSSMNSTPAASRARRTARSFAAVIDVSPSVSSARRIVATPCSPRKSGDGRWPPGPRPTGRHPYREGHPAGRSVRRPARSADWAIGRAIIA